MRQYDVKQIEGYKLTKCIGVQCDICGAHGVLESNGMIGWSNPEYKVQRTLITIEQSEKWLDGVTVENIDICPNCFIDKLKPWVKKVKTCQA